MKLKLHVLTAGALFFLGQSVMAQQDTTKTKNIEEVVVLGYISRPVGEVTGGVTTLKAKDIDSPSAISVDQALQGKVPGVVVNTTSGSPGAFQDIRIRGISSFSASNSPLFVVDGVPIVNGNNSPSSANTTLSSLASLNNDDIASITVLKDANATAIYGARGTNGVIVITTKKGKRGKTKFNFDTSVGYQTAAYDHMEMLTADQRLQLLTEGLSNQTGWTTTQANNYIYANDIGGITLWDGQNHDWGKILYRKDAQTYTANISASGGDEKSTFYSSLGYNKTYPITVAKPFERLTGTFNYTRKLTDRLNFAANFQGSWISQDAILEGGSYFSNPFITKILMSPWVNPYNADGTLNIEDILNMTSIHNTLYTVSHNINRNKQIRSLINARLDYKIMKGLTLSQTANVDFILTDLKNFQNRNHGDGADVNGASERYMSQQYNINSLTQLNYNQKFGKHRIDASVFMELIKNQVDDVDAYGENIPADGLTNVASTSANFSASSTFTDWRQASYFGALNYVYNDRYVINGTFRREGSSRFATGHRFGDFWSVGAAWNVYKEDWIPKFFNDLRIRGSYGKTGNNGVSLNSYQAVLNFDAKYAGSGASYVPNFGNPLLTWEKAKSYDVGLDFAILNSRVSGTFEYYNRRTYDLLQSVPLSLTTGFPSINSNTGAMRNQGYEGSLNVQVVKTTDLQIELFGSIATVKNRVLELAKTALGTPIDVFAGNTYKSAIEGQPFQSWFMPTWAGVDPQTGAPNWYVNGVDGAVTTNINAAKRVLQGNSIPKYTGGFGTNINYKGIFLNANFYYAGGHKIYEQYAQFYYRTNSFTLANYNGREELMNRWQKPGDITDIPKLSYSTNNNFHVTSSRFLHDGEFIRLKDVTLGYNLPKAWVEQMGLDNLSFSVRGTNLWTWVKDKSIKFDPEVSVNGFSQLTTPPVRTVMFGVNVQF